MRKLILINSLAIGTLLMASCGSTKCIEIVQSSGRSYADNVDEHNNITLSRVIKIDEATAEDIFTRANTFFVYNYNSSNSVIQQSDKDRGLIIGKGLWSDIQVNSGFATTQSISAHHILRVDAKDGRARISVTVQSVDYTTTDSRGNIKSGTYNPADVYPYIAVDKVRKAYNTNTCIALSIESRCQDLLNRLENDLKHGSTSKSLEDGDW